MLSLFLALASAITLAIAKPQGYSSQAPLARNQIGSLLSSATDLLRQQDQFQGLPSPTRDLVDEIVSSTQELAQSEQNSPAMREQALDIVGAAFQLLQEQDQYKDMPPEQRTAVDSILSSLQQLLATAPAQETPQAQYPQVQSSQNLPPQIARGISSLVNSAFDLVQRDPQYQAAPPAAKGISDGILSSVQQGLNRATGASAAPPSLYGYSYQYPRFRYVVYSK